MDALLKLVVLMSPDALQEQSQARGVKVASASHFLMMNPHYNSKIFLRRAAFRKNNLQPHKKTSTMSFCMGLRRLAPVARFGALTRGGLRRLAPPPLAPQRSPLFSSSSNTFRRPYTAIKMSTGNFELLCLENPLLDIQAVG